MTKKNIDQLAEQLSQSTPRLHAIPDADMLSTGCVLENMAFSGRPNVAIPKGTYVYYIGASGSLKTWQIMMIFAEATRNRSFDGYRLVYDGSEFGALMGIEHFFGAETKERIVPPKKKTQSSSTAQEFYYNLAANCNIGPCIYALDSMDGLNDDASNEKFEAELKYHQTGKGEDDIPGSMGMEKAKTNSQNINRAVQVLRDSGSILIVISQTRDRKGGYGKTRSGGHALKFYAHLEAWTSIRAPIIKTYLRKEREIGATIQMDVQKNRVCGWEGKIEIDFIKNFGVDCLGTSVNYLLGERHWEKVGKKRRGPDDEEVGEVEDSSINPILIAPEFNFEGRKEKLIELIQDKSLEWELQQLVAKVWREIIEGATPNRKPKYR